jgi:drug/metabolite transporter (DMT)-like permease
MDSQQLGLLFAILTAASFAVPQVLVRKVTYQSGESFTALAVSMLVGTPIFVILVSAFGEWHDFLAFTPGQYAMLAAAGLVHLIIARFLFFSATRIIGANPTAAITRTAVIFSVIFGVVFLGESITGLQIFAALLIMFGAILTSTDISRNAFRISTRGLLMSLGCALCSAGSATLIRPVMEVTDSIYAATFVMYLAGFIVLIVILLSSGEYRNRIRRQDGRSWSLLSVGGLFLVLGHLFRFSALQRSPVSIVQPLVATIVLFVLLFSWLINRRIDVFNWRVIAGIVMVLAGVALIYL